MHTKKLIKEEGLKTSQALAMTLVSVISFLLVATVHLATNSPPDRAISLELHEGNPLAWLLIAALCLVLLTFTVRLWQCGHVIRTALLLLDAAGLLVIAFTSPETQVHQMTFLGVSTATLLWFAVMGVDCECQSIYILAAVCILVLPLLAFVAMGLAEKALILYCLFSSNVLYYAYLREGGSQTGSAP